MAPTAAAHRRAPRLLHAGLATALLAVLPAAPALAQAAVPVGVAFGDYRDPARPSWIGPGPRPLQAVLWYPAAPGAVETDWQVAIFRASKVALQAPLRPGTEQLPLVLLSHGTGSSAISMGWLARSLATAGYVVAAVNHHGNTAAEPRYLPQGFALWWERPRDLSVLLDRVLADPRFAGRIDTGRVGVAGFSLGGYSALALVGARVDHERWTRFCAAQPRDANCSLPAESPFAMGEVLRTVESEPAARASMQRAGASYLDPRIRAAFVIAPVQVPALSPPSLAAIQVPVRLLVGEKDEQAPPAGNAELVARQLPGARLTVVPAGSHYMFLAPCTVMGKLRARAVCVDPRGVDRDKVQEAAAADAVRFFDGALRRP